jgi:hypothetical protein
LRRRPTPLIVPPVPAPGDEGADAAAGLLEDLDGRRLRVHADVGRVVELVGQEPPALRREPARDVAEVVGAATAPRSA